MKSPKNYFRHEYFEFDEKKGPSISPNNQFTILRLAIISYYETYQADGSGPKYFYTVTSGNNEKSTQVMPVEGCSHGFLAKYYISISYTQLFLELYLVGILDSISPRICRLRNERTTTKFIKALNQDENDSTNTEIAGYRSILKRVKALFEKKDQIPEKFRIPAEFKFLEKHIETFEIIVELRNEIMHSNKKFLKAYPYEVLFTNHILPLVKVIVEKEGVSKFFMPKTQIGLNPLSELANMDLPYDYSNHKRLDQIYRQIHRVSHLKELARASFQNPIILERHENDGLNELFEKMNHDNRQVQELKAELLHSPLNYYQRYTCPCCGINTLMTFDAAFEFKDKKHRPQKAECLTCTYSIRKGIGEPSEFGIMDRRIFNPLVDQ